MDTLSNILKYIRLPLSLFAFVLSAPQAAQISDKERYLLRSSAHYKYDDNKNVSQKNELEKAFLNAAKEGDTELLKLLKIQGVNVRVKTKNGNNALHYAAFYAPAGRGIVWLIDSVKIPIESKGQYQRTPFLWAANKGNLAALKILKGKGANVYATTQNGNSALHCATLYAEDPQAIAWLIDSVKIPIDIKGQYQKTPFICAAEKDNLALLKMLKWKGANVYATDQYRNNALHYATLYAPAGKSIAWLIDYAKIPIESKGQHQKTPFLCAAEKSDLTTLKLLKQKGANVHAKSQYHKNALHFAAIFAKEVKIFAWLIDSAKVSIEAKGKNQRTPFICAAQKGNLIALKVLKKKGANVYTRDKYGYNALHFAVMFAPNGKGIAWLIDSAHIDIESKGQSETTPFICAAQKGNLTALKILKNKGANVRAKDKYGYKALYYAKKYSNNKNVIDWLKNVCQL